MLRPAHLRLGTPSRNSPALVGAGARQNARRPAALLLRAQAAPAPGERRTAASAAPPAAPPAPAQAPPPAEATFATADETVQIKPQTAADGSRFVWTRNWYPLTALDYLDPSRPAQLKVLGYDLVVWRDGSGTWRAFRDACPHRAAPLSEGRIDPVTKNLECAYHGWQFGGGGAPQEIPQSDPGLPKQTACASGRGCAQAFPTAEAHGLVWAWLEPGPAGEAAAAKAPLPTLPAADHRGVEWFHVSTWYVRDLEVDFLPLLENSCDPGHVHFTHAGYIGSRDKAGPMNVRLLEQDEEGVYRFVTESPDGGPVEGFKNLVLKPPCMLWGSSEGMSEDGELALLYFVVPVAPGKSRLMSLLLATNKKFRFLAKVFHWQPWLRHLYNRTVAAQDIAVLHRQGTNMASPEWPGWRKGFYLPTRSDAGVVVLRKWLDTVAGGGIAWGPNIRPGGAPIQAETRRELLFDHYHQHTEHCPHCRAALARVRSGAAGAAVAVGAAFLTLCAAWGRGVAPLSPASLALLCVLGAALAARSALEKLEQQFIFSDWRHADH